MRLIVAGVLLTALQASQPALRIVVVEGENAVNIIQQKTAVRPLVEVRDRNNVPVAGATVTFTIGSGQPAAFGGGLQTLTVTTNAAGRAAASTMSALGPGTVQINVQAAFQGEIASAAISQTNFATAAAAAQASGAASGGAAGGGGGISGTTIGIVGGAVAAGGAIAATQLGGDHNSGEQPGSTSTPTPTQSPRTFTGTLSFQFAVTTTVTSQGGNTSCVSNRSVNATVTITLTNNDATGRLNTTGTMQEVSVSGGPTCPATLGQVPFNQAADLSGGPSGLTGTSQTSSTSTSPAQVTVITASKFTGAVSGNSITGTFGYSENGNGTNGVNGVVGTIQSSGQASVPITLARSQ